MLSVLEPLKTDEPSEATANAETSTVAVVHRLNCCDMHNRTLTPD
jgi:hypothetical protein